VGRYFGVFLARPRERFLAALPQDAEVRERREERGRGGGDRVVHRGGAERAAEDDEYLFVFVAGSFYTSERRGGVERRQTELKGVAVGD
jgi:hypothetical protein